MNPRSKSSDHNPDLARCDRRVERRPSSVSRATSGVLRYALAAGACVTIYLVTAPHSKPHSPDAVAPHGHERMVGQANAVARKDAAQSVGGLPAPSSTANEGNVVDMTF